MKIHIPKFIREDFLRKSVAVFFAALIWFAVNSQLHEFETFHDIPVTFRHQSDKVALERRIVTARVQLRGAHRRLQDIQSSDITITAQIPVVPEGVYSYDVHLSADNVRTPPGTRVESIEPENVRVQVDRIISREIPVRVRETGELAYGYKVVQRNVLPPKVSVTGPSRIVEEVDSVTTEPVLLDETVRRSFEVDEVQVVPIPRLRINPENVHVSYDITHQSGEKVFTDLPIRVLLPRDSQLTLENSLPVVTVNVRGPNTALEPLKAHMVRPFIDLSAITAPGRYTFKVNVWIDETNRFIVEQIHPHEVNVVLTSSNRVAPVAEPPLDDGQTDEPEPLPADDN
jgi:YbbR domain-containing protein